MKANASRSMPEKAKQPGDLRRSHIQLVPEPQDFGLERRP